MKYLYIVLFFALLSSCNSKDKDAQSKVEKMQSEVSELNKKFQSVDLKTLSNAKKQYDESIGLIKKYYFKDTIDVKFMNSLDYYKNIKYNYKTITKNKLIIKDNIVIVEDQLATLKTDLENSSIQGKQLNEALANESNNIRKLDSTINIYLKSAETILMVNDSIANYIKKQTLSF